MRLKNGELNKRVQNLIFRNPTFTSRQIIMLYCEENKVEYSDSVRTNISKKYRQIKKENAGFIEECERAGIEPGTVKNYWYKSKNYSIHVKEDGDITPEEFVEKIQEAIKDFAPKYPAIKRVENKEPHCLVLSPADVHIGKLCSSFETGEEYNSQIAVKRVKQGVEGLLNKAQNYNLEKIIFVTGNDILHVDNPKNTTTAGTHQDTSGMWYDNFIMAKKLLIEVIESLLTVADVEVVFNPSNHDFMSGFMLVQAIESWFAHSENISFNINMSHRKYSVYGENLIGTTHMDGAKVADLPLLMAHEAPEAWSQCKHRYIYGHHVHHKTAKDFMSVIVETLRSPSGTDGWHHRQGYQHSPKAIEGFIHHPKFGQIARLTELF